LSEYFQKINTTGGEDLKNIHLIICIAVIVSMPICFSQSVSTSGTPSQEGFAAGITQSTPLTETPSQAGFETNNAQTGSVGSSAKYNLNITKVIKEGDALHVIVANNGSIPANLTDWMLTLNNGIDKYAFPNFSLNPNTMVTIHTHKNVNTATNLFGSNFMWNGTRDVELIDQKGMLVSEYILQSS
jgi:hypothetical protein